MDGPSWLSPSPAFLVRSAELVSRGADVVVDWNLNTPGRLMTVVLNTAQAVDAHGFNGAHPAGSQVGVCEADDGTAYVEIRDLPNSEVLVLANHPEPEEGGLRT